MYNIADARLNPTESASAAKLGEARPAMLALEQAITDGRDRVGKVLDPLPETAPQAAQANALRNEAVGVSRFALQLAGRTGRAALISGFLQRAGAADFLTAAADYARDNALVLAPGVVPLTISASKGFDPRFHPAAGEALLGDAWAVGQALSSQSAEDGVLGAVELKPRFEPVRIAAERYAEAYLRYWSEGRNEDLAIVPLDWTAFSKALADHNQTSEFIKGLERQIEATEQAVRTVSGFIPKGFRLDPIQILEDSAASRATLTSRHENEVYDKILGNWRQLPSDVGQARDSLQTVIGTGSFDRDYVPARPQREGQPLGDLCARFWERFALAALTMVASGAQKDAIEIKNRIGSDPRSPLVPPREGKPQLSVAEVVFAARSIDDLLPPEAGSGVPRAAARPAFEEQIQRLLGQGVLTPAEVVWFSRVRNVLRGLPATEAEVFRCRIAVLRKPPKAGDALAEGFSYIGIAQGDAAPRPEGYLRGEDGAPLGTLTYPGPPVRIGFFARPDDQTPVATRVIDGPWGALQLLHMKRGESLLAERIEPNTKWTVELLVPDAADPARLLSVWLQLEFQKELPALKDWPPAPTGKE
jgi:hypothetical protein